LIIRGLCHPISRKELFSPYSRCKAGIKNVSALLTHLDKKHELTDMCCKELMRCFIYGLYPERIDIVLKTEDGITVNRLWDVKRRPVWAATISTTDITMLRYTPRCIRRYTRTWKHWDDCGVQ
jgi:hypothetical protein